MSSDSVLLAPSEGEMRVNSKDCMSLTCVGRLQPSFRKSGSRPLCTSMSAGTVFAACDLGLRQGASLTLELDEGLDWSCEASRALSLSSLMHGLNKVLPTSTTKMFPIHTTNQVLTCPCSGVMIWDTVSLVANVDKEEFLPCKRELRGPRQQQI